MHCYRMLGSPHDAEDLVQSFFAVCLEKEYLAAADREKGRFRSFLLLMLKRFLANEYHKSIAAKRGGARRPVELDALAAEARYAIEPVDRLSADKLYERRWALTLLEQVLAKGGGGGIALDRIKPYLLSQDPSGLRFSIANARKDLDYYNTMAADAAAHQSVAAAVLATLEGALADGGPQALVPQLASLLQAKKP